MLGWVLIIAYVVVMLAIGFWGMKKTKGISEFFIGNRNIGAWISAFSYGTSYFSAVLFIGFAGKLGWAFGLDAVWIGLANALIGGLLSWLVLGRRTRVMTHRLNVMTMPEFLEARYDSRMLKVVSALIIFVFLIPYSASVFQGLGYLFENTFNMSYDMALLLMVAVTGVYLVLGGYFAVTLTDFIQGLIMLFGTIAVVVFLLDKAGGVTVERMAEAYAQHMPEGARPGMPLLISLIVMTSFGTWGLPQMVQKFYAIKSEDMIKKAAVVTAVFALVIAVSAYFIGAMSHLFFDKLPLIDGKPAFDAIIPQMLMKALPKSLMAVIVLLVFSASMSTLSSLVLVSASAVSIDLIKGHIMPSITEQRTLVIMRVLSAVFVALSYIIAKYKISIIVTLMSLSWGTVAGAFMAPYIYGLFWRRASKLGAWAGMLAGLVLSITLFLKLGTANAPIAAAIAMSVPFVVVPAVSLFSKPVKEDIIKAAYPN